MKSRSILSFSLLAALALTSGAAAQTAPRGGSGGGGAPRAASPAPRSLTVERSSERDGLRVVGTHIVVATEKGKFVISRDGDKIVVKPDGQTGDYEVEHGENKVIIRGEDGVVAEVELNPDGGLSMATGGGFGPGFGGGARGRGQSLFESRAGMGGGGSVFGGRGGLAAPRAQLGITLGRADEALAAQLDVNPEEVILITNVVAGQAAEKAGLKRHDIIVAIDGEKPASQARLRELMRSKEPDDALRLDVLREGKPAVVEVKLEPFAPDRNVYNAYWDVADLPHGVSVEDFAVQWQARMEDMQAARGAAGAARREWAQRRPEMDRAVEHLRREAQVVREELRREMESWREMAMDEELRAKLRESLARGSEQAAKSLEQAAEALSRMEIEIEARAPRVEILREGGGARGMVVHPQAPPAPAPPRGLGGGAGGMAGPMAPPEVARPERFEQRFERMEQRMERLERMIERLLERDGD